MTTRRWGIATVVVVAVIAIGMGLAAAGDRGAGPAPGGMMGAANMGTGMMASTGSMDADSMGVDMMTGGDMMAMHEQMMATMAGAVPPGMLARCSTLYDQMRSVASDTAASTGHATHHWGTGNTG